MRHGLSDVPLLGRVATVGPFDHGGDGSTVNAGFARLGGSGRIEIGPVFRHLVEAGAWERPRQELPTQHLPDQRYGKRKFQRVPKDKTRRHALSVSVSVEEENILRAAAVDAETSFSDWARRVLFKAAGKKVPSRTRGGSAVSGE
jgi:hypothetical protein